MKRYALEKIPFFVYGTLIPGQPNDHLWRGMIKTVETAYFSRGKLYDMGYYPMLVEEGEETVIGKLISVPNGYYKEILNHLDNLEGYIPEQRSKSSYMRVKRTVESSNGHKNLCWVYTGSPDHVQNTIAIPGGNWVAYTSDFRGDLDNWWDSVDTVFGLHINTNDTES